LLVKCKGCSNKIDRDTAYKVVVKGENTYYCDVKEYETINIEKESKNKVIDLSFEIIGKTTNTALFKELTEIAKVHTYTKMLNFMEENMMELDTAICGNSPFVHEYAKIRYFAAIIKNQIGDFKEKVENTEVHDFDYVEDVKYTPTKKKSFTDFIDEY
jgi:NifU-like protein involved in Fe-S cluster formation